MCVCVRVRVRVRVRVCVCVCVSQDPFIFLDQNVETILLQEDIYLGRLVLRRVT